MANNVKGITIEFNGDTTKLDKAMRQIRAESRGLDKELAEINRALKFNPKNTELLAQKQTVLKQKVEQTSKSLSQLKDAQKQLDSQGVDKNSEEYRRLQREIITTESKLKHFSKELQQAGAQASKIHQIGVAFDEAGKKIESAGRSLKAVSTTAGAVTAALGGITYAAGATADDLNTLSKVTGISTYDLQMYAAMADLVDVSVETLAKSQGRLKKSMLTASQGGSTLQYFEQLGVAVTDSNGELRDSNDVFQDVIKALGQMENETERDAVAMQLFGKSANELNPLIEDAGATYEKVSEMMSKYGLEPISQEDLDRANEFNDTIDTMKLLFVQAVQIVGNKIAGYLLPAMEKVLDKVAQIAEWVGSLSGETLARIMAISGALSFLAPALVVVGKLVSLFGLMQTKIALLAVKVPMIGKALAFISANPIVLVIAALVALVAIITKAGLSADEITAKINNFALMIQENMPQIIETVIQVLTTLIQTVAEMAPALVEGAVALFTGLVDALPIILPVLLQGIADLIMAIIQALPGMSVSLIQAAVSIAQTLWKGVQQVFGNVVGWFGQVFGQAWQAIRQKFAGWASFWGGLWESVKRKFTNIGTSIANAISGAVKSGINGVISTIEGVINRGIDLINGAIGLINKIPGVNIGTLGRLNLPRLAKGGVLNGAQTVIAGEAGPEAIIPLDRLFNQLDKMYGAMGGDGMTINVYGAEGQSVKSLADEVAKAIIREQNRRRLAWQ